jgi:GNAT superfamily N-acetyltransferase
MLIEIWYKGRSTESSLDGRFLIMLITIAAALPTDCSALCDLLDLLFAQEVEFTPDRAAQIKGVSALIADAQRGHILVARSGERVIGMVSLLYTISTALGGRAAILEDMIVAPANRGQGVGSKLLTHAVDFARSQDCRRITLLTDGDNLMAQTFYRKYGFTHSPMIPMRLAL